MTYDDVRALYVGVPYFHSVCVHYLLGSFFGINTNLVRTCIPVLGPNAIMLIIFEVLVRVRGKV